MKSDFSAKNQISSKAKEHFLSRAGVAESVERLSGLTLRDNGSMMDPGFQPHQCLLTGMWKRMAQWPCWPPRGQQMLHQR